MTEVTAEQKTYFSSKNFLTISIALLLIGLSFGVYGFYKGMKADTNLISANVCTRIVTLRQNAASPIEYHEEPAGKVDFSDAPEAAMFYTKITEALAAGPGFAGHFAIATWGCGTSCQDHAIVDVKTGRIVAYGLPSELGISFALNSRILVTNPASSLPRPNEINATTEEDLAQSFARIPREYYELVEDDGATYLSKICVESASEGVYHLK
ncbi:MAG: hypothetical protein U1D31_00920 [Patescibacteria group bacterium]|nr:hypothetical protein [bacterium]MDZ4240682.1 hypothetical protein [Patescibacteria group bacterium]